MALRIAEKNSNRVQMDGAEAPDLPPPETLRQEDEGLQVAATMTLTPEPRPQLQLTPARPQPAEMPEPPVRFATTSEVVEKLVVETEPDYAPVTPVEAEETPTGAPELIAAPPAFDEAPTLELPAPEPAIAERPGFVVVGGGGHNGFASEPLMVQPVEQDENAAALAASTADQVTVEPAPELQPAGATEATNAAQSQPEPLDEAISDLLKHLDETLDMIRSLRSGTSS